MDMRARLLRASQWCASEAMRPRGMSEILGRVEQTREDCGKNEERSREKTLANISSMIFEVCLGFTRNAC